MTLLVSINGGLNEIVDYLYRITNGFCGRMCTILAQFVDMSCKQMIMIMRAGRSRRRRLKKREKVLQMLFVVVNTCMYR